MPDGWPHHSITGATSGEMSGRHRGWFFTDWDVIRDNDYNGYITWSCYKFIRYVKWQLEQGDDTHGIHAQGYMILYEAMTFTALKQYFPTLHIEPLKSQKAADIYVSKEATKLEGPFEYGDKKAQGARTDLELLRDEIKKGTPLQTFKDQYFGLFVQYGAQLERLYWEFNSHNPLPDNLVFKRWQTEILALLQSEPQRRRIIWIWSQQSTCGKSTFMDYLDKHFTVLIGKNKMEDTVFSYNNHQIIWYDIPRTSDIKFWLPQFERLSNLTKQPCPKYHSCDKYVIAHIVVTTNSPPPHNDMPDRIVDFNVDE